MEGQGLGGPDRQSFVAFTSHLDFKSPGEAVLNGPEKEGMVGKGKDHKRCTASVR